MCIVSCTWFHHLWRFLHPPYRHKTKKDVMSPVHTPPISFLGFPDSSAGKESPWNTGDPSSIPALGRSPGEGIGYPLQYSWTSLVAQLLKSPPAMWPTWVQSLGWEDPLEKGKAIVFWPNNSMDCIFHGVTKSWTQLSDFHFHILSATPHLVPNLLTN